MLVLAVPLTGSAPVDWHTRRFGSKDYLAAGALRALLVRSVNEDLTESARSVPCPALLLWGTEDRDTPTWLARRYRALMAGQHDDYEVKVPLDDVVDANIAGIPGGG